MHIKCLPSEYVLLRIFQIDPILPYMCYTVNGSYIDNASREMVMKFGIDHKGNVAVALHAFNQKRSLLNQPSLFLTQH